MHETQRKETTATSYASRKGDFDMYNIVSH